MVVKGFGKKCHKFTFQCIVRIVSCEQSRSKFWTTRYICASCKLFYWSVCFLRHTVERNTFFQIFISFLILFDSKTVKRNIFQIHFFQIQKAFQFLTLTTFIDNHNRFTIIRVSNTYTFFFLLTFCEAIKWLNMFLHTVTKITVPGRCCFCSYFYENETFFEKYTEAAVQRCS